MELTKPQIEELRTRLDSRSATLRSASGPSSPSLITEGDSRSPEELEQDPPGAEAANVIDDLHSGELRDIEAARGRLAQGLYGTCVDCGFAIPYARLRAFPAAERCLACQQHREQTGRLPGRAA